MLLFFLIAKYLEKVINIRYLHPFSLSPFNPFFFLFLILKTVKIFDDLYTVINFQVSSKIFDTDDHSQFLKTFSLLASYKFLYFFLTRVIFSVLFAVASSFLWPLKVKSALELCLWTAFLPLHIHSLIPWALYSMYKLMSHEI